MIRHANIFDQKDQKQSWITSQKNLFPDLFDLKNARQKANKNARQKANKNINKKGKMKAKKVAG